MPCLGVVGTLVWDTILPHDDSSEPFVGWGGITYSLEALEAALRLIPPRMHERIYLMCELPRALRAKSLSEIAWHGI